MDNADYNKIIVLNGRILDTTEPVVMSIINITPDSFYSGSRANGAEQIGMAAENAVREGAQILDIGGYSTRPGADFVSEQEEMDRVRAALEVITKVCPDTPLSVDTFRGNVARMAVKEFGVAIINDVSAFELDDEMLPAITELQVPYVLMHSKGTPKTMQSLTQYDDFKSDILKFFALKKDKLRQAGFEKEIIIDPGYGFAKTVEQNYSLIKDLSLFECFNAPLLVGISRKSMIYKPLGITPEEALNGTSILNAFALERGANILRVHDTKEAVEAIKLYRLMTGNNIAERKEERQKFH